MKGGCLMDEKRVYDEEKEAVRLMKRACLANEK